jgi:hypothetical protein
MQNLDIEHEKELNTGLDERRSERRGERGDAEHGGNIAGEHVARRATMRKVTNESVLKQVSAGGHEEKRSA